MARSLPVLNTSSVPSPRPRRAGQLRLGIGIEVITRLFGWWWADPLAALALVYFIVQEGREALHEARTGEHCSCCACESLDQSDIVNVSDDCETVDKSDCA